MNTSITANVHHVDHDRTEAVIVDADHAWITIGGITFHFTSPDELVAFGQTVERAIRTARPMRAPR
jgi:hypothetical protein